MRTDEDNQKSITLNIYIAFKDITATILGQSTLFVFVHLFLYQCRAQQITIKDIANERGDQ